MRSVNTTERKMNLSTIRTQRLSLLLAAAALLGACSTSEQRQDAAPPAYGNPAAMAAPRPATSAEPCPTMPLRRVNPGTARSWQDIIDARNAELADAARKECWPQRGPQW